MADPQPSWEQTRKLLQRLEVVPKGRIDPNPLSLEATIERHARRRVITERLQAAQDEALRAAWTTLRKYRWRRYQRAFTEPFLIALNQWCACQWHKELGFPNFPEMASHLWIGSVPYWRGWEVMATKLPWSYSLWCKVSTRLRELSLLHGVLDDTNWRSWIALLLSLEKPQLEEAIRSWKEVARTGYYGTQDLIFVPLWVPQGEYLEALDGGGKEPAWETIKAHFKEAGE